MHKRWLFALLAVILLLILMGILYRENVEGIINPTPTSTPTLAPNHRHPWINEEPLLITDPRTLEAILTQAAVAQTLAASPFMATPTDTASPTLIPFIPTNTKKPWYGGSGNWTPPPQPTDNPD